MKKKNKKNVIWLHSHFHYWMGGTKFIHHVAKIMNDSKLVNHLEVVVEGGNEDLISKFRDSGIKTTSLNQLSSNSALYWVFLPVFILIDVIKLKKIINSFAKEDQVTIISSMFPMNVVAMFLGKRHVQNCYEPFAFFYDSEFIKSFSLPKRSFILILKFLYSWLDKLATKKADSTLTLNNVTKKLMKEVYGVNSVKTQAGVDSKWFKPYVSRRFQQKFKGKKVVIHSTDYSPVKGTDKVIRAFSKCNKTVKNSLLLITTTIEDKKREDSYRQLANELGVEKKVIFLGFVPYDHLPQYYSLATVMVQGSTSSRSGTTSMSLPVKEAMCCETPAIRPDIGGEDVVDGKSGYLIDPSDTDKLSQRITKLLKDNKLAKAMGKKARKDIASKYTWENTAKVFLENL